MLWTQKYAPKNLKEVAGNESAKEEVRLWALEFDHGKTPKPVLIHGPTGCGKTALAQALAKEKAWETVELNASDLRDAKVLEKIMSRSSSSLNVYGKKRLFLIDEVDSVKDKGEFSILKELLKESKVPIILTADNYWSKDLAGIRLLCKAVELKKVNRRSVLEFLNRVCKNEKCSQEVAEEISQQCEGDVRSALVDLQANCQGDDGKHLVSTTRVRSKKVFDAVRTVLKGNYAEAMKVWGEVDEAPETFLLWIEENVPAEYEDSQEVAKAFDRISRADIYLKRVRKTRDWGFMRFVQAMLLGGVASSKRKKYYKFARYGFPSAIRVLGATKKSRSLLKNASLKVGRKTHCSSQEAKKSILPFLWNAEKVSEYFEFDQDEASMLSDLYKYQCHEKRKATKKKKRKK